MACLVPFADVNVTRSHISVVKETKPTIQNFPSPRLAMVYGGCMLPRLHSCNLLIIAIRSERIQDIFGDDLALGTAKKLSVLTADCLWGSTLGFLSGFTFRAFSVFWIRLQSSRGLKSVFSFPQMDFLPGLSSSIYLKQLVMRCQSSAFTNSKNLVIGGFLRCMP